MLVVAHVHYSELWSDIEDRLARVTEPFDLIVTVTEGAAEAVVPLIRSRFDGARVFVVGNRGRDWGPMVALVNRGMLTGYEAIAKVHTKKSEHRIDGDGWRISLLDGVFESPAAITRIVDLLSEDRRVGLVVPNGHVSGPEHWGSDLAIVESLAARLPMEFDPADLKFPAGSMFWCRPWVLERLADFVISDGDFEPEAGQYDGTTAHALERLVGILCTVGGMDVIETMDAKSRLAEVKRAVPRSSRVIAFYLPQYYPVPENDLAWGEGFTDWVNVKKARPLFSGHRQPNLPAADLGTYDLRDSTVLREQGALARRFGVHAMAFHYYWFDGHRVLDGPIATWLQDTSINMRLMVNWANEPWTRTWDGLDNDVLIRQEYTEGWEHKFCADLAPIVADRRYVTWDSIPVLSIYRLGHIPNVETALMRIRAGFRELGISEVKILASDLSRQFERLSESQLRLVDGTFEFPPGTLTDFQSVTDRLVGLDRDFSGDVFSMAATGRPSTSSRGRSHRRDGRSRSIPSFPGVMPGWDNTPRRGQGAYVFYGSCPATFRGHLQDAVDERQEFVFINAWNEWAEGAALEPSERFGPGFLSSVRDVIPSRET